MHRDLSLSRVDWVVSHRRGKIVRREVESDEWTDPKSTSFYPSVNVNEVPDVHVTQFIETSRLIYRL